MIRPFSSAEKMARISQSKTRRRERRGCCSNNKDLGSSNMHGFTSDRQSSGHIRTIFFYNQAISALPVELIRLLLTQRFIHIFS